MTNDVNAKRRYRSTLRKAQAAQTQTSVLDAARRLFVERGWTRTTIAAIAGEAGVSSETIYSVFGSKRVILERLVRDAVRGDAPDVPLLKQAVPQQVADAADQRLQLHLFAKGVCSVLDRVAPLVAVVRAGAESETTLGRLYQTLHEGRRRNLVFVPEALAKNGPLRDGMDVEAATEAIFRLTSPELFLLMRNVEERSVAEISGWLEHVLVDLLLPPRSAASPNTTRDNNRSRSRRLR